MSVQRNSETTVKFLVGVVVAQSILIGALWFGAPSRSAMAQIPDPGAQQAQIIQLLGSSNDKLDKITALLQGGNIEVQVRLAKTDQKP